MKNYLITYSEIALKSASVRKRMELLLIRNTIKKFERYKFKHKTKLKRISGRILLETNAPFEIVKEILTTTPGIKAFAPVKIVNNDIDSIVSCVKDSLDVPKKKGVGHYSFALVIKRPYKQYPYNSVEVARIVGKEIVEQLNMSVDLTNPDKKIHIELHKDAAYIYTDIYEGIGGLPIGTGGRVLCLISGGIDSPVASFLLMKRGLKVKLLHFVMSEEEKRRVMEIKNKLALIDPDIELIFIDHASFLKKISQKLDINEKKYICVLCKRRMLKVATEIAKKKNIFAICMGNNLGQVATQTLDNLSVIMKATDLILLQPLVGFDKEDVISISKRMGLFYEKSLPSCPFVPKKPSAKVSLKKILELEERLSIN